jgi:hypothetical protein
VGKGVVEERLERKRIASRFLPGGGSVPEPICMTTIARRTVDLEKP